MVDKLLVDNAARIDLYTSSFALKKQDHSISLFQYVSYIQRATVVTYRRTSVAAPRMIVLYPMTAGRLYSTSLIELDKYKYIPCQVSKAEHCM